MNNNWAQWLHHKLITKALQKTALDRFKDGDHWPALASLSSDVLSDAHKQDVYVHHSNKPTAVRDGEATQTTSEMLKAMQERNLCLQDNQSKFLKKCLVHYLLVQVVGLNYLYFFNL